MHDFAFLLYSILSQPYPNNLNGRSCVRQENLINMCCILTSYVLMLLKDVPKYVNAQ